MKKKIVYVINHFSAGAVPNILFEIIPYIQKKYEVKIVALQKIDKQDFVINKFKAINVEIDSLNISRHQLPKSYFKLKKYLQENNPVIIHSNLGRADFFSALSKPRGVRLISTLHSVKGNYNIFTRIGYKIIDKRVDIRTAVSHTVKDSWYKDASLKSKSCTIYNPVNVEEFNNTKYNPEILRELGLTKEHKIILNVGNLKKQKGQIYLIRSFEEVLKARNDVRLVIVGKRSDAWNEIKNEITKLNLQDKVILTGFREDIPELLKLADIFVFPSLTEGLGIAVLEAMAAKVPVVASDLEAISEYIENEKNGFLVRNSDTQKLADTISNILSDENLREELTINAYKKVNKLFLPEKIASEYLNLYNNLAK